MKNGFQRTGSLGWLVAALSAQMARGLDDALKAHGLDIKVWPTLMCLWERDRINQTELSAMALVPAYTTTRVIDRLEAMGLVERRPDPASRRNHLICLTPKGKRLEAQLTPLAQGVNERFLGSLNGSERKSLIGLLQKVLKETTGAPGG